MPSSQSDGNRRLRTYHRAESVVFYRTRERFGGLSNMASGYPLTVNSVRILTTEALYQACRFPHLPELQRLIIGQRSPMTAKMKSKPHRKNSRPDWDRARNNIMRLCLRVKLAQHYHAFGGLLLATEDRPIVEQSSRDDYWGAKPLYDGELLVGRNVLGRLLMELRELLRTDWDRKLETVEPPDIHNFILLGRPIRMVTAQETRWGEKVEQPVLV